VQSKVEKIGGQKAAKDVYVDQTTNAEQNKKKKKARTEEKSGISNYGRERGNPAGAATARNAMPEDDRMQDIRLSAKKEKRTTMIRNIAKRTARSQQQYNSVMKKNKSIAIASRNRLERAGTPQDFKKAGAKTHEGGTRQHKSSKGKRQGRIPVSI